MNFLLSEQKPESTRQNIAEVSQVTTIKARCQRLVPIKPIASLKGKYQFFEPEISPQPNRLIARSIQLRDTPVTYANVINTSESDIIIECGAIIGTLTGDVEVDATLPDLSPNPTQDNRSSKQRAESIQIGPNNSKEHQDEIIRMLERNINAFQWPDTEPRVCNLTTHKINTGNHPPVFQRQYQIPSIARIPFKEQISELRRTKMISESKSSWNSPVLLV